MTHGMAEWQMANGYRVHKHGYGFNPYIKIQPAASMDYNTGEPERKYQGILKPVHNLLDSEARLLTQYEAILRQYAWRTIDFYGMHHQQKQQWMNMNYLHLKTG